jgi:hypothetical protein
VRRHLDQGDGGQLVLRRGRPRGRMVINQIAGAGLLTEEVATWGTGYLNPARGRGYNFVRSMSRDIHF